MEFYTVEVNFIQDFTQLRSYAKGIKDCDFCHKQWIQTTDSWYEFFYNYESILRIEI